LSYRLLTEFGEWVVSHTWALSKYGGQCIDYIDSANHDTDHSSALCTPLPWGNVILDIIDFATHYFIEHNEDGADQQSNN
jgi:hypothetical protein